MFRYILAIGLLLGGLGASAQTTLDENYDLRGRGLIWGFQTSSAGVGVNARYEIGNASVGQAWIGGVDLYIVKDPHEVRIEPIREQGRRYVFNKQNHFLVLTPSVGRQFTLAPRTFFNQIGLHAGIQAGPAIGILNPYYLEICQISTPGATTCSRVIEAYNPDIHAYGRILGRAPLVSTRITPSFRLGLEVQGYTTFDFTSSRRVVSGINVGFHIRAFPSSIPILVESEDLTNQSVFVAGSVGFLIGNRW